MYHYSWSLEFLKLKLCIEKFSLNSVYSQTLSLWNSQHFKICPLLHVCVERKEHGPSILNYHSTLQEHTSLLNHCLQCNGFQHKFLQKLWMDPGCPTSKLHLQYSSPQPLSQQLEPDIVVSENHQQIQPNHQKKKKSTFTYAGSVSFLYYFLLLMKKAGLWGQQNVRACVHTCMCCARMCVCVMPYLTVWVYVPVSHHYLLSQQGKFHIILQAQATVSKTSNILNHIKCTKWSRTRVLELPGHSVSGWVDQCGFFWFF